MVEDVYICIQRNAFVGYNIPRLPENYTRIFKFFEQNTREIAFL